jgi:hypothetical protein
MIITYNNRNEADIDHEHIDRSDAGGLIAEKAAPTRGRLPSYSHHVFGNRRLAYLDAELEQFAVNPGSSPERIGGVHLPNKIPNFAIY